ncbi:MAG: hypothetical protein AAF485_23265, partial [Chloroflexota bacterium]
HQEYLLSHPSVLSATFSLFRFLEHNPTETQALIETGVLPWWTLPDISITFWRPVSAVTHWLDYRLWPHAPALMHMHSVIWFGLLVGVVSLFYRQLLINQLSAALVATLLYGLDEAHGFPVAWLANRNAILATFFGVLTILVYDKWRRDAWQAGAWLTPLFLGIGLLSAEAAIAALGYLLAHALFLDSSPWRSRLTALIPATLVVLGWRIIYWLLGYGTWGSAYADPLIEPWRYIQLAIERAPILLLGQFTFIPAELYNFMPWPNTLILWSVTVFALLWLGWVLSPLLRQSPLARFFASGMLLSIMPSLVILPMNRLLFFAGLGGMGLIALFLQQEKNRPQEVLAKFLIVTHFLIAPISLLFMAASPNFIGDLKTGVATLPDNPEFSNRTMVVIAAPSAFYPAFIPYLREHNLEPSPPRIRLLASTTYPVEVTRVDDRTLLVQPVAGYFLGFDSAFRGDGHPFALQEMVPLSDMRAEIMAVTADGRPSQVMFHFAYPLESEKFSWFYWQDGAYKPFVVPDTKETVKVSPFSFYNALRQWVTREV